MKKHYEKPMSTEFVSLIPLGDLCIVVGNSGVDKNLSKKRDFTDTEVENKDFWSYDNKLSN